MPTLGPWLMSGPFLREGLLMESVIPRRHVVISGTGRAGTSFLVELLTHLGLDTGYEPEVVESRKFKMARAGLEHDIRRPGSPYIVKSPNFCNYSEEVLKRDDIKIEHVFVPVRDLTAAAESRRFVTTQTVASMPVHRRLWHHLFPRSVKGGVHPRNVDQQEQVLLGQVYNLALSLSGTTIPVTLMRYPKIVNDAYYLYQKLQPVLKDMPFAEFESTFARVVRKDLVHSFSPNDN